MQKNSTSHKLMSSSAGRMADLSRTSVQKIQDKSSTLRNDLRHTNVMRPNLSSPGGFSMGRSVEDEHLQKQIEQLRGDLKRRQETYVRRERAYTVRIEELEQELAEIRAGKTKWMKDDKNMATLKKLHYEILKNVDQVQERTAKILQEQERDLNRSFKARLFDVQTELEKEKGKKDDGAAAYIEKSKQLEDEVDRMKEMADRLDRVNASLMRENARLKSQFQTQEEDRDFLIKQLVQVKRENKRLNQQIEELEKNQANAPLNTSDDEERLGSPKERMLGGRGLMGSRDALSSPMLPRANSPGLENSGRPDTAYQRSNDAAHNRLKDINKKLRKLLDRDRKNLEMVRKQLTTELKSRTELETMLRQCVDDVKKEIKKRRRPSSHMSSRPSTRGGDRPGTSDGVVSMDDFNQQDREATLELLLSQERVIQLLYSKTFPPRNQEGESSEFAALAQTTDSERFDINAGLPSSTAKSTDSFYKIPSKESLRRQKSKGSPLHEYMPAINS